MSREVVYSMSMSLDGYIAGPDGDFSWGAPDAELHRFHNERVRAVGVEVCGRRLYETMTYWEEDGRATSEDEIEREFAAIWQALPKVVVSATLDEVVGNTRLSRGPVVDEVAALRAQDDPGQVAVGGATLAAACIEADLVDVFDVFVCPVVVGGGTPFLPPGVRLDLELVETRTFASRVVHLRYRRV